MLIQAQAENNGVGLEARRFRKEILKMRGIVVVVHQ